MKKAKIEKSEKDYRSNNKDDDKGNNRGDDKSDNKDEGKDNIDGKNIKDVNWSDKENNADKGDKFIGDEKYQECQRCNNTRIFNIDMGFKVSRSEWYCSYKNIKSDSQRDTCIPDRFFSMEDDSPFKGNILESKISICLDCGQTQGKFPATNPFECLQESVNEIEKTGFAVTNKRGSNPTSKITDIDKSGDKKNSTKKCECRICEYRRDEE